MNRVLSACAVTIIGVVWLVTFKVTPIETEASALAASPSPAARGTAPSATPTLRTPTPAPSAAPGTLTPSVVPGTPAASGTFLGSAIRTIYGDVQVRIVVTGQKITDVQAVLLPQDRARSARISQYSAPILRSEAISAQSAKIDIVSGATYTSIAYSRSLDSALQQANLR
jgi:uncharacterized protein with FMN-binding domain